MSCGVTGPFGLFVGAGHTIRPDCVTVAPGPVTVWICSENVTVVVTTLVAPGWTDVTVVPPWVKVVVTPGITVVKVDVNVDAGIVMVEPAKVIVDAGMVRVEPGALDVTVGPVKVIVVKLPDIDVVMVVPGAWLRISMHSKARLRKRLTGGRGWRWDKNIGNRDRSSRDCGTR